MAEVAHRAGINRTTVYQHFRDVDALLTDAMEDAVAQVARAAALCPRDAPRDEAPAPLHELFGHVADNAGLYRRMLGAQGSARFAVKLRERLIDELTASFREGRRPAGADDVPPEVHAAYLAGALVGTVAAWIDGPRPAPPADMALAFWRLLRS